MGLFRLFWIPVGMGAQNGAYVRYNHEEMLSILALESQRAKAFVIGEDLGTVEPGVRETLAGHSVLSYRLVWFEPGPPSQFPVDSLAAVTTHDLPTIAGTWTGADTEQQRRAGLEPNDEGAKQGRQRLQQVTGISEDADVEAVITRAHEALAGAPSRIVVVTLDDALSVAERPNIPGPITENCTNWSLALPLTAEEIPKHKLLRAVAQVISRDRPG